MKTLSTSNMITNVSRRGFFKATLGGAAGLALAFSLPEKSEAQFGGPGPATNKPNAYIHIGSDDKVTLTTIKAEMGQGPYTAIPMILAEELDCDWKNVSVVFAPVDPSVYGALQSVVGSQSIRTLWTPMRIIGATARAMLVEAAAQKWGVPATQVRTDAGFLVNTSTNARISYGSVAEAAANLPVPTNVAVKDPKNFRILGTPVKRLDTRDKVTGRTQFGMDARPAGLVYAVIERSPVFGGKVATLNAAKAKAVPGVKDVIQVPAGVAVIANSTWAALQGRKQLEITWDEGANGAVSSASISRMFADRTQQPGANARKAGDAAAVLASGAKRLDAVYEAPYLAHAAMEPMNCTAQVTADRCEIWAPSQMQTPSRDVAAMITGLPKDKVQFHSMFMGGGFGRRGRTDFVEDAVHVAKALNGTPVKVVWSREDDIQHDWYRPASYVKMSAALDASGMPSGFHADVACPPFPNVGPNGVSGTAVECYEQFVYDIPNINVDYHRPDTHVPVSFWRSVGWSQNTFFFESFIDELAAASGKDPVDFRRQMLAKSPRMLGVLNLAAEKGNWGKAPAGRTQGFAITNNIGSFTAQVAEISVTNGKLKVHKVVAAVDCGHIVNPAIIRAQIESGIVYGLAAALKGSITIDKGRVQQSNFNNYDVLRMDEMPEIEVYIVPSTEAPGGIGEASTPGTAPAVANAIFKATGKRLRSLPIRNQSLA
ncbi:MAG TPA: xanthine dehydrogenase family protein molybdopterin-binding subunit [Bryobacteraceae bacterium]|nr:xanthine dehydrogenase family protein molybdopterin-binding subunit [Bryobacteraceae bacterium]